MNFPNQHHRLFPEPRASALGRSTLFTLAWMFAASAALHLGTPHSSADDLLDPGASPAASIASATTQAGAMTGTAFIGYRVSGDEIALEWSGTGLLQTSESVTGPWVTLSEARSPYAAARVGGLRFYRLASTDHSVVALDATTIRVVYDRLMGLSAINPSNYAVSADDGSGVGILSARFGPLQSIVDLATTPQANADYQLTINNVQDSAGQPVYFEGRKFTGNPKGAVVSAAATSSTRVIVAFNEPMADNALAPQHYTIRDSTGKSLAVTDADFEGPLTMVVALTTVPQANLLYTVTVDYVTDLGGDPLATKTASFQGIAGQLALSLATSTRPTALLLTFNVPMSDDVLSPAAYRITQLNDPTKRLEVLHAAFVGSERRVIELTTAPQASVNYVIGGLDATTLRGTALLLPPTPGVNLFTGNSSPSGTPAETAAPRVVGAASISTNQTIVAFSEPMSANAILPEHYVIVQENVNPEAAFLRVYAAEFYKQNPSTVLLTTSPQNELTYRVTVVNATDLAGVALAPKVTSQGVLVDPTSTTFPGTPPIGAPDTDGDGLSDNVETRGWIVTVKNVDGTVTSRGVTSDPAVADTDGDELNDAQEANLRFDPRSIDTDDDQLSDYAEFNEIYSNGLDQDTDNDTLDDYLEFSFFRTSPLFADTDGDQIGDGDEIIGNRNPRVSDLPRPEISVGEVNLQLNVRFTESNAEQRRDLETKAVNSTLTASEKRTFTRQDTVNMEVRLDAGTKDGVNTKFSEPDANTYVRGGFTVGFTFQQTDQSEAETQKAYQRSLSTDREVTKGFTAEREVQGAVMQVAVNLRNLSSLAYRVKNLQVTAFIQDPQDHGRLTPVATLLPDQEPAEGFTLGPLAADRGPFIFSNTTIVPTLVEALMANSSGLIFRISNYDIIDERGRNFAFTGQEIIERTSRLVIDFGGASSLRALVSGEPFDEIQPGDETEIHRVATSAGRPIDDTNGDGRVDRFPRELFDANGQSLGIDRNGDGVITGADDTFEADTVVIFDGAGKEAGISLHQAMSAIGLVRYDEASTPTTNLTDAAILGSYSTIILDGREKIFRIRGISNDSFNRKFWEILTPLGVDQVTDLNDLILKSNTPVSLNFVQDLDGDGLTADVEFFLRTSDSDLPVSTTDPAPRGRDTDRDGLDDRYEALIGWTVTTPLRTYKVWSSPNRKDSNFDDLGLDLDPLNLYDGSDAFAAPGGWIDRNGNNLRDGLTEVTQTGPDDYVLDPIRRDTDGDGIDDANEIVGFSITRITDGSVIFRGLNPTTGLSPNPLRPDTDGDTFLDGFERLVGLDPTDPEDLDTDGDGLPDPVEDAGWPVTTVGISLAPFVDGLSTTQVVTSSKNSLDTDQDGLTDFEEFFLKTDPRSADSDRDGIHDILELRGYILPHKVAGEDLGIITTLALDADTDNDKRSDGDEAELVSVELARWVVRVAGQTPYRVFSHPLLADADFDFVVDGDEFALDPRDPNRHTDPNNGNTDGDRRDDGAEISGGTNPLAVDLRVTVIAESVETSAPGQYNFALNVRPPNVSGVAGLGDTTNVFENVTATSDQVGRVRYSQDGVYIAGVYYRTSTGDTGVEENLTRDNTRLYDPGLKGILPGQRFEVRAKVSAGPDLGALPTRTFVYNPASTATLKYQTSDILTSADFDFRGIESPVKDPQDYPLSGRSVRFGLADGERFSIEGFVQGFTVTTNAIVKLGGLEGDKALQESASGTPTEVRPVFSWIQVADKFLEEYYFEAVVNGATVKIKFYYLIE